MSRAIAILPKSRSNVSSGPWTFERSLERQVSRASAELRLMKELDVLGTAPWHGRSMACETRRRQSLGRPSARASLSEGLIQEIISYHLHTIYGPVHGMVPPGPGPGTLGPSMRLCKTTSHPSSFYPHLVESPVNTIGFSTCKDYDPHQSQSHPPTTTHPPHRGCAGEP